MLMLIHGEAMALYLGHAEKINKYKLKSKDK